MFCTEGIAMILRIIYHSLIYKKRQLSVSYFVKYGSLFGTIMTFIACNGKQYALIKRYEVKNLFSNCFVSSKYYSLLLISIDEFFFVLEKTSSQVDVVDAYSSLDICIVIEEVDSFVVSPMSAYHEHD
ncbi:unnamed protein product [Rotaria magnacalcarata]|uniref:Uncharacterized protein n=1 Tax=Rotaria magnacalcarata TaxID=392030 RepID=A0A816SLD0_9BILA|nr:unnamed protein product [Rotaria magnacalcarata]CAF4220317.1 unnamed protein product [Rotaria magnacalcarata]